MRPGETQKEPREISLTKKNKMRGEWEFLSGHERGGRGVDPERPGFVEQALGILGVERGEGRKRTVRNPLKLPDTKEAIQ